MSRLRCTGTGTQNKEIWGIYLKFLMYLSSSAGNIDAATMSAWIPSPEDLAAQDRLYLAHAWHLFNVLALGARVYERLGRDDDAAAAAQFGIDQHKKKVRENARDRTQTDLD